MTIQTAGRPASRHGKRKHTDSTDTSPTAKKLKKHSEQQPPQQQSPSDKSSKNRKDTKYKNKQNKKHGQVSDKRLASSSVKLMSQSRTDKTDIAVALAAHKTESSGCKKHVVGVKKNKKFLDKKWRKKSQGDKHDKKELANVECRNKSNHKEVIKKKRGEKLKKSGETSVRSKTSVSGSETAGAAGEVEDEVKSKSPVAKETDLLPRKPEDVDCNWKKLLQTLEPSKKKKKFVHKKKTACITEAASSGPEIWFDDVDEILLDDKPQPVSVAATASADGDKSASNPLVKHAAFEGLTKVVGMDCEMVGVGDAGHDSILARVSIVNQFGKCLLDKYVKARETVTDFRTHVSGIRPEHIDKGEEFVSVQRDVGDILKGRLLVGHALTNDFKVLFLDHPHKMVRDTSRYKPFRRLFNGKTPSLKKLTEKVLSVKVQEGEHDSVQDAQAAMRLYTMYRAQWEKSLKQKMRPTKIKKASKTKTSVS